jgi:hypothetical protein
MQLALDHCTDGVGLFSGGDLDSIFITFFDKGLFVNSVKVMENFLHFFLNDFNEGMAIGLYFVSRIAFLPGLLNRAQK